MTPHKPGDRVIVRIPEPVIGVVHCLTIDGAVIVEAAGATWTLAASGVRPAMPRDASDLERWPYWYLGDEVVLVRPGLQGLVVCSPKGWFGMVSAADDWRGPVARPPEVRS